MSVKQENPLWAEAETFLRKQFPNCRRLNPSGPLTFELDNEEWTMEIFPNGTLACQSGYDLEEMKSILSDGTAEDLGSDELAKQTKFYLHQAVSKYRNHLKQEGFTERTEITEEYVAVVFEREIKFDHLDELEESVRRCQALFSECP